MKISFDVPLRTGRGENNREHWRTRANRVLREKTTVKLAAARAGHVAHRPGSMLHALAEGAVRVTLTRIAPPRSKGLDGDNLPGSLKAVRDAVAELLGRDDRESATLSWAYQQATGSDWFVRVEIERAEPMTPGREALARLPAAVLSAMRTAVLEAQDSADGTEQMDRLLQAERALTEALR